jgi:hypothetical protein
MRFVPLAALALTCSLALPAWANREGGSARPAKAKNGLVQKAKRSISVAVKGRPTFRRAVAKVDRKLRDGNVRGAQQTMYTATALGKPQNRVESFLLRRLTKRVSGAVGKDAERATRQSLENFRRSPAAQQNAFRKLIHGETPPPPSHPAAPASAERPGQYL